MKSVLRWAGSKKNIAPRICELYSASRAHRYIEPFCGSAVVLAHMKPERFIISDVNRALTNFLEQLRRDPEYFHNRMSASPVSKTLYYEIRKSNYSSFPDRNFAFYFLYLNRNCFNGIYRTSKSGKFNVPFSDNRTPKLPNISDFYHYAESLRNGLILCGDFQRVVSTHVTSNDFVYLDPPYSSANKRIFHQYDPSTFGIADIDRLAQSLEMIDQRGATFVLSYANVPELDTLRENWNTEVVKVRRTVAGDKSKRGMSEELLISNRILN